MKLLGRVAIVTGASSGIGRTAALRFAEEGAKVAVIARRQVEAECVVAQIRSINREAIFVKADVANEADVQRAVRETVAAFGRLDCAFNNAGVAEPVGGLTDLKESDWNSVIDTNLKGVWLCMKHQIPEMLKAGGGAIVNMSSIYGLTATGMGIAAYVASKHGVIGLSKAAALEYAQHNVRVNAVCPGWVPSPANEAALSDLSIQNYAKSMHPLGRLGTQKEIADMVVWLLSKESSFTTGQAIAVDGGYTAQ